MTEPVAIDLRTLLEEHPGGVGVYTRALLGDLRAVVGAECVVPVATGRRAVSLDQEDARMLRRVRIPNPLLNPCLALLRRPRLDGVAGCRRYLLPNWNFLALDQRTELTLVVHDLSFERNPHWFPRKQRFWHHAVRPRVLAARADRIIAVSEWTKHDLETLYGIAGDRIQVIHPAPDRPSAELPFPIALPERFILFLGTVEERKNPLSLVAAFERIAAKHPDTHLVIAGKRGYGAERVLRASRTSPVAPRIHCLGYVPVPVRRSLYRKAAVFAYPSFYEGFGIPLLDAMRAGVPIVTGNRSAMPEVVGDAGVLIDPGDVSQLALALDEILTNDSFARFLAERGRQRATRFPESMESGLRSLFG